MGLFPRRWSTSFFLATCAILTLWYLSRLTDVYAPPSLSNAPQPGANPPQTAPYAPRPGSGTGGTESKSQYEEAMEVFHWTKQTERFPVSSMISSPSGQPVKIPYIQVNFGAETVEQRSKREEYQAAVKESFVHSWEGYKKHAWRKDELKPVSGGDVNSFGGWAATLVDTLDTLWMMGMKEEFELAVKEVETIDFTTSDAEQLNLFETTIRYLGGLVGAYDISESKYPVLLEKAKELGEVLYSAFDTPNRMPVTRWYWKTAIKERWQEAGENSLIAEVGSLTLEFTRLSQLTGDPKWFDAVQRIMDAFDRDQNETRLPGMWPVVMNAKTLSFGGNGFTLGGMADSLYEYFPKQHLLLGGLSQQYKKLYETSMVPIKKHILWRPMTPDNQDILFPGNTQYDDESPSKYSFEAQGQHLGCFAGGMVGIGAKMFDRLDEMHLARKLTDGCIWAYESTFTGLMPEKFYLVPCDDSENCVWDEKKWHAGILARYAKKDKKGKDRKFLSMSEDEQVQFLIKDQRLSPAFTDIVDARYILRPEAIESVFIMYRLTGDPKYRDAAWRMFTAIEKYTRTSLASSGIDDVTAGKPEKDDRMESFWLAETLKYFYAIFSEPDVLSLDDFVL
ncbi:hypothetical protein MMC20_005417 [Loxospora ochrophaea]|nr:hypothetical protein [Loxospora ochrophaea]